MKSIIFVLLMCVNFCVFAASTQYYISPTGNDDTGDGSLTKPWQTLHKAMFTIPFDENAVDINLRKGTYVLSEALYINEQRGGSESETFRIRNYETENAILDGSLIPDFGAMISIASANNVTIEGLEMTNLIGNKSGLYIAGASANISILNNKIHGMHWTTDDTAAASPSPSDNLSPMVILGNNENPMTSVSILNNEIYDMTTGYSEAVKIVGNVDGFLVQGNEVHDISNICIVAAGNYAWVGLDDASINHARNGIISHNETYRCVSPIAASAGIYVDGGQDVFVSENYSHHNIVGFSVGSEQPGTAEQITLSHNQSTMNTQAGLVLGTQTEGADVSNIVVTDNSFENNYTDAVYGGAPIIFSNANNVTVINNEINSISQYMLTANGVVTNLNIDSNEYTSQIVDSSSAVFVWAGISGVNYFNFNDYKAATGQDKNSTFN